MTSSRVVRGTKGRIFLCVCGILIITGLIACYNNTLSQLEDVRKSNDQCHQQQENLSTQLQVIFDYKQRLEKSLKTEKAEHIQSKKDSENRIEGEKSHHEKAINEANIKLSSLQQHYNLLQTEHEDFKEECSKIQQQQLNENNNLQSKLKEVQGQLKQSINEKENSFEHLKTQYLQIQVEKENLEKQIKGTQGSNLQSESEINHLKKVNHQLQRELDEQKTNCLVLKDNPILGFPKQSDQTTKHSVQATTNISGQIDVNSRNNIGDVVQEPINVADFPEHIDEHLLQVENQHFDNNANVLAAPNSGDALIMNQKSSTTKFSTSSKAISRAGLEAAQPLHSPTISSSSVKNKQSQERREFRQESHVLALPYVYKKFPVGVPPVPDTPLETLDESKGNINKQTVDEKEKDIREDVNNAFPNRYHANLILNELANEDKAIQAENQVEVNKNGKQNILKADVGDKENNALEVFDSPINDRERNVDSDPFGLDDAHNAEKVNSKQLQQKLLKHHANGPNSGGIKSNEGQNHKIYDANDGADYDKDVANDMQLEENDPEAEDDDPEYADHIARQKDPAVRN